MLNNYCSIHKGFSVVLKSSTICFFINASLRRTSDGIAKDHCLKQQHNTIKLMAPTNNTINKATNPAKAKSNSSSTNVVCAGTIFSMAKPA